MHEKLLAEIETFLSCAGMSEYRFGIAAVKNGRLVERLRNGRRIWPDTEARVRSFIRSNRGSSRRQMPAHSDTAA